MFTGIIEQTARIKKSQASSGGLKLTFEKPSDWTDLYLGESIASDGVCLTVAAIRDHEYDCVLVPETLSKTTFGKTLPTRVNLERAISLNARLDGHFVQGHVDGLGQVKKINQDGEWRLAIRFSKGSNQPIINKGSMAVNGVSLTVAALDDDVFEVALVPFTLQHTSLGNLKANDFVNLEFDMIGKYVAKLMEPAANA